MSFGINDVLNPKNYKVKKLDSRYTGSQYFKYLIDFNAGVGNPGVVNLDNPRIRLQLARNWFWTSYGPSGEYEYWATCFVVYTKNPDLEIPVSKDWAWDTDYGNYRIYIKDDQVLSHWVLAHS
jgi:hypothetical protein